MKRLLLVGGGHAQLFVLEDLVRRPIAGLETILVTPHRLAPYSGMIPGVIAGHYSYTQACVDLEALASAAGCALRYARVRSLDAQRRVLGLDDGAELAFDLCSLDIGSAPDAGRIPGAAQHGLAVKPIENFVERWNEAIARHRQGRLRVAVVGAGAAGIELVLAMQYRLQTLAPQLNANFALVSGDRTLLPGLPAHARRTVAVLMARRGIALHLGEPAEEILADGVRLAGRRLVQADFILLATGAAAARWPIEGGLAGDQRGFVLVDRCLRSRSHAAIFAAGDIASVEGEPRPKAGVWAVRAGPLLAANLRAAARGDALVEWSPQRRALALLSCGDKGAVAAWWRLSASGAWVWRWKDHIDRRFIRRFSAPFGAAAAR